MIRIRTVVVQGVAPFHTPIARSAKDSTKAAAKRGPNPPVSASGSSNAAHSLRSTCQGTLSVDWGGQLEDLEKIDAARFRTRLAGKKAGGVEAVMVMIGKSPLPKNG